MATAVVCKFVGSSELSSETPDTKVLCEHLAGRLRDYPNFQLIDLFDFISLRCTETEDVLRNSMVSVISGRARL